MKTTNAIIESARIEMDGAILSAWLTLDYSGSGQGFGGWVLGGHPNAKCGRHHQQANLAGEFIVKCLLAAGVDRWDLLPGKSIRVRKTDEFGSIVAIGHIVRDDCWFCPEESMKALAIAAEVLRAEPTEARA